MYVPSLTDCGSLKLRLLHSNRDSPLGTKYEIAICARISTLFMAG